MKGIEIDKDRYEVRVNGRVVELAPKEFDVLLALHAAAGSVLSRDRLIERVWHRSALDGMDTRAVDQRIAAIRRKIKRVRGAPEVIKTVTTRGYRWVGV